MPTRNLLLASLSSQEIEALGPALEYVPLELAQPIHESDRPISYVYFPTKGVISMVNEPTPGEIVEVATIGLEGAAGLPVLLDADSMPSRAFVQVPGEGFRMPANVCRKLMADNPRFHTTVMRYILAVINQIAQSASCNRLHEVQERCARWLLQTHDRVQEDSFLLTQEFLGQMLGVRRPTVSVAAGMLQKAGLIDYSRGRITILDRPGLEKLSCPCYGLIVREYQRLLEKS